jgi:hypothetical protein
MTKTKDRFNIKNYVQEIAQINSELKTFKESDDKADESFLKVGELLVQTKNEKELTDKHFTRLKTIISETLGKSSLRNINKVVHIAQCEAIQKNRDKLPKSWSALYALSSAKNVGELISSGKITPDSTRSEITRLAKVGNAPAPLKWIYVELAGDNKTYTSEQVEALKVLLKNTEWTVKVKKEEPVPVKEAAAKK